MAHTMSARSEVSQELKQITERSMDLMRVIRSVSQGEGGAETADSVMKLLIHTDAALQEAVVKRANIFFCKRFRISAFEPQKGPNL